MPTNTMPAYVPGNYATSQAQYTTLLNDLNNTNAAFWPSIVRKYGPENYALIMNALGRSVVTERVYNKQFQHSEDSNLHSSIRAAAQVTGTGAGAVITITAHSSDHFSSGTKSPIVVGHVYEVNSSGVQAQCTAANTTTANAHTFTLKPINTADAVTSAGSANVLADELFLDRGAVNIGEGSDKISGLFPTWTTITNTTTEHRDDLNISDVADSERLRIAVPGTNGAYRLIATDRMNRRYMNDQTVKLFEGVQANNITGTYGTVGLIPRVAASGINIQYTAGSMTIADIQALTRGINFFGGTGDYHAVMDQYTKEAMSDLLFTTYKGTFNNVNWQSVGGNQEAAAAYGFDVFRINNVSLFMWVNPMFSTDTMYKRTATVGTGYYKNYCILIPQKLDNRDAQNGDMYPSFQIVYQAANDNSDKIDTFETGAKSPSNKTTKMERNLTMISYPGARVFGASQFASFKGV